MDALKCGFANIVMAGKKKSTTPMNTKQKSVCWKINALKMNANIIMISKIKEK